jgi:MFS family permease
VAGTVLGAAGLAGLTYGFTAWTSLGPGSPKVYGPVVVGALGMAGFVYNEHRSRNPMLPLSVFANRAFSAANLVTFVVYAALSGSIFLVGLNLQVVAQYPPIAAGLALLPITIIMLLLSARSGALAEKIGPRIPMTVGPLVCAVAFVWLARIGAHANYWTDVLPPVTLQGLGLSATVAPLTATALGSVDDRHAGIASGVNNAVARAAGLLAVAVLPLAAGLGTGNLTDPAALRPMYRTAMLICAVLLVLGAVIAGVAVPTKLTKPEPPEPEQPKQRPHSHCAVGAPPLAGRRSR